MPNYALSFAQIQLSCELRETGQTRFTTHARAYISRRFSHTYSYAKLLCGYGLSTGPTGGLSSWWSSDQSSPDSVQQQKQWGLQRLFAFFLKTRRKKLEWCEYHTIENTSGNVIGYFDTVQASTLSNRDWLKDRIRHYAVSTANVPLYSRLHIRMRCIRMFIELNHKLW